MGQAAEISRTLRSYSRWFCLIGLFSAIINVLYLTSSLYMIQVYDRVLASHSIPTLVAISAIVLVTYLLQALLDALRGQMLARVGADFDRTMTPRLFEVVAALPLSHPHQARHSQPVRDLDQIRSFLGGLGPTALFDLPFLPLFMAAAFVLHPWLGLLTAAGGGVIVLLTIVTDRCSRGSARRLAEIGSERHELVEATRRNAEVIAALGMQPSFLRRYLGVNDRFVGESLRTSDIATGIGAFAKVFRLALQSSAIGLGAYLVIQNEMSAGSIIAASILISRALAPIETAVAHWKGFAAARQAYRRIESDLELHRGPRTAFALPRPSGHIQLEDLVVAAPGQTSPILKGVALKLQRGDGLGIIGPTGSGKSTLARCLVGVWRPARGRIRIDGADLSQWGRHIGEHIGYLPQDIELFEGTIAQNIARFAEASSHDAVLAAARAADAHETIVAMPNGYETQVGASGAALSGGQRQRIALARALYGDPFLVVLDEPNANLDGDGDDALTNAIRSIRERGGIVIVVTHRSPGLAATNLVAVLKDGQVAAFGPRDAVMKTVERPSARPAPAPRASNLAAFA